RMIGEYSGIAKATPLLAGLFLFATMSSIALPGLNGFVGEFPILLGAYQTVRWAAVASTFGVILAAIYLLWAYQRVFHGPVTDDANRELPDLNGREVAMLAPVLALIAFIGIYPTPFLERIEPAAEKVVQQLTQSSVLPDEGLAQP
ncbi:MAG TPA: proton-conducting transporter membrane subunit, partial [Vicinamibacterales bacterium]|nr:proton-conducting transporter membrane subunit [Vicinamibacterales bacterium]